LAIDNRLSTENPKTAAFKLNGYWTGGPRSHPVPPMHDALDRSSAKTETQREDNEVLLEYQCG
jgi:hypothetical protein